MSAITPQPFDARCVCPAHGWPPDTMADVERLRTVAKAAQRVLQDPFSTPIEEVPDADLTANEQALRELLTEHRKVIR